jgi:hydrogenase nickel incorporation protein HypB
MDGSQNRVVVEIGEAVLGRNAELAALHRKRFQESGLRVLNIVSSPGSGKTALLERTLTDLRDCLRIGVIVGDLQTDNDARRLQDRGAPVVQVTTGGYCHLDASMIARAMEAMDLRPLQMLIIENVGNLVCPASYDLGESARVVLVSVTEGEDKPLKYPVIFERADVAIITKIDLAEAVGADMETLRRNLRQVAPRALRLELSARSGQGMEAWYRYLKELTA